MAGETNTVPQDKVVDKQPQTLKTTLKIGALGLIAPIVFSFAGCLKPSQDEIKKNNADLAQFKENTIKGQQEDQKRLDEKLIQDRKFEINTGNLELDNIIFAKLENSELSEIPVTSEMIQTAVVGNEVPPNGLVSFDSNAYDLVFPGKFTAVFKKDNKFYEDDIINFKKMPTPIWSMLHFKKQETSWNSPKIELLLRNDGEHAAKIESFQSDEELLKRINEKNTPGVFSVMELVTKEYQAGVDYNKYLPANIYSMFIDNGKVVDINSMQRIDTLTTITNFNNALHPQNK